MGTHEARDFIGIMSGVSCSSGIMMTSQASLVTVRRIIL